MTKFVADIGSRVRYRAMGVVKRDQLSRWNPVDLAWRQVEGGSAFVVAARGGDWKLRQDSSLSSSQSFYHHVQNVYH